MMKDNLSKLFFINSLFTFMGGLILIFVPTVIFGAVGVHLQENTYFISYLLGATAISFSILSIYAAYLKDKESLKSIALTFLIFHISSSVVGVNAFLHGLNGLIWVNIIIHLIFSFLFLYLGLLHISTPKG